VVVAGSYPWATSGAVGFWEGEGFQKDARLGAGAQQHMAPLSGELKRAALKRLQEGKSTRAVAQEFSIS